MSRNPLRNPHFIDRLTQRFHRFYYPVLTRLAADEFLVLSAGYEEDPPLGLPMDAADERQRLGLQLYYRTATQAEIAGRAVLEVGCGHGGGASYLVRALQPASYMGLDVNPATVAFCRKRHVLPGLHFVQGDAQALPFPDGSFDAVVNIESSAHYPSLPRFLAEVSRVLRPGGHFLYADSQPPQGVNAWEEMLAAAPLRMVSERVINAEVLRAMEGTSRHRLEVIDRRLPPGLRGVVRRAAIARMEGTCEELRSGGLSYRMYCFVKD